ncbi:MAG: alanine--tRNA ligase [Planctomycetota bacterium]
MTASANDIRQQFIDFFVDKHGHANVPSSPVVPHDDPTLLFANAGMNQFKPYFLGTEQPPTPPRAANTQKCIRAGGKHNDLDDVGKDTYHHTFFEMLGNWSFGDYFKEEAIDWAWELLTVVWGLDPERLHATYFEGDESEGLEPDLEAKKLWEKYLPPERIHPGNKKDNFWEMGDTGPCGPCSELHYDGKPDKSGGPLVNQDDPDVIEIWNLVFIQFNRMTSGELENLPAKHVDTGMGFERIVRVLQSKDSNYDTDVFAPIFTAIQNVTAARAYVPGGSGDHLTDPINVAYRVIADHIRTLAFALTDGAHCGNEGRDYVLRSILRRAVRYGRQTLGVNEPFFYKLVPAVVDTMGGAFPELKSNPDAVAEEIRDEEESFSKTLDRGIVLFDEAAERGGKAIAAQDAFQLHDTYGFPISLTQLMAEERGMSVDVAGFEQLMEEAREKSRGTGGGADAKASLIEQVQKGLDAGWYAGTNFTGYETSECPPQNNRLHLFVKQGEAYGSAPQAKPGDEVAVVLQMTPFYAEQGGQVGDTGSMIVRNSTSATGGEMVRVQVTDCIKVGEVHVHLGKVSAGTLENATGDVSVALAVDLERRKAIEANHTVTHVMNRALRDHVNEDAAQRGSLVDDEKTRFDFAHNHALTDEQLAAVEDQVNADIAANLPVFTAFAPQEQAMRIHGLRAVFGEKYPPTVRIVSIGADPGAMLEQPDNAGWANVSVEFCGGTHLGATGQAGTFTIVSQESVSKGVRRVTALTGEAARQASDEGERLLQKLDALADASADALPAMVDVVIKEVEAATLPLRHKSALRLKLGELNERVKQARKAAGNQTERAVVDRAREIADSADDSLVVEEIAGADGKTLRTAMDVIRKKKPAAAMLLAASFGGKVALLASVPDEKIAAGLKAGDWIRGIRGISPIVGGGGGGRADMAQAGGKDANKLPEALEAARAFAAEYV